MFEALCLQIKTQTHSVMSQITSVIANLFAFISLLVCISLSLSNSWTRITIKIIMIIIIIVINHYHYHHDHHCWPGRWRPPWYSIPPPETTDQCDWVRRRWHSWWPAADQYQYQYQYQDHLVDINQYQDQDHLVDITLRHDEHLDGGSWVVVLPPPE